MQSRLCGIRQFERAKSNAIFETTWVAGTHKIMEQAYVGTGRALDPQKYFVVIVNQIGGRMAVREGFCASYLRADGARQPDEISR